MLNKFPDNLNLNSLFNFQKFVSRYFDIALYRQAIHNSSTDIMFSSTAKRLIQYVGSTQPGHIKDPAWSASVKAFCEKIENEVCIVILLVVEPIKKTVDLLGSKNH